MLRRCAGLLLALALCLPGAAGFGAPAASLSFTGMALRSSAGTLPSGIQFLSTPHSKLKGGCWRRRPARALAPRMNLFDLGETLNPFASRVDMVMSDLPAFCQQQLSARTSDPAIAPNR